MVEEPSGKELVQQTIARLASMEDIVISECCCNTEEGRITIFDLPDRPGNCSAVFQAVAAGRHRRRHDRAEPHRSGPGRALVHVSPRAT